jgi:hypothetical protein
LAVVHVVVNDLFFADRLGNALRQLGHQGRVVDVSMEGTEPLPAGIDLLVADLEAGEPALAAIRAAREAGVPVLAFGPHTDLALRESALTAGATRVVAKSKLTTSFPELIEELIQRQ